MSCGEILSLDFVCKYERGERVAGCDCVSNSNLDNHVLLCECVSLLKMLNWKIKLNEDRNSSCMQSTNL